jgi:hypothetical protein
MQRKTPEKICKEAGKKNVPVLTKSKQTEQE